MRYICKDNEIRSNNIKSFREGIVRPCRIGEDGKPKPIEHVLELQSELPKQQYSRKDSDSE